ncbi:MAG: hypothetical protein LRY55_05895 [Leadbetterella sp.]|nr:hypothetical protein [Leadbetterella sp.]
MKKLIVWIIFPFVISGCGEESVTSLSIRENTASVPPPANLTKSARLYDPTGTQGTTEYPWGFLKFNHDGKLTEELSMHPFNYFLDEGVLIGTGTKTRCSYDHQGNLAEKTEGDNIFRYVYEDGRMAKLMQYKRNASREEPDYVKSTYYKYNSGGLIAWEAESDFNPFTEDKNRSVGTKLIRYTYDAQNRLTEKLYIDNWSGRPFASYEKEPVHEQIYRRETFSYSESSGKLLKISWQEPRYEGEFGLEEKYTETYSYDAHDRLTLVIKTGHPGVPLAGVLSTVRYEYDEHGRLSLLENKEILTHQISRYTYDTLGRILTEHVKYSSLGSSVKEPRDWLLISYQYTPL